MDKKKLKCEKCYYYTEEINPGDVSRPASVCRRMPPNNYPTESGGVIMMFTITSPLAWCGEFKPSIEKSKCINCIHASKRPDGGYYCYTLKENISENEIIFTCLHFEEWTEEKQKEAEKEIDEELQEYEEEEEEEEETEIDDRCNVCVYKSDKLINTCEIHGPIKGPTFNCTNYKKDPEKAADNAG